jgi:hypothetical protein
LVDVRWSEGTLSGTSLVLAGDPYAIYLTEPEGYRLAGFDGPPGSVPGVERAGALVKVTWLPSLGGQVGWLARFEEM